MTTLDLRSDDFHDSDPDKGLSFFDWLLCVHKGTQNEAALRNRYRRRAHLPVAYFAPLHERRETSTAPATSILLWDERPPPPVIRSSLARKGISVSSISAIPEERAGRRDHGPPQLGAQQPRRLIGAQRKQPLQLQRRNSVGVGGHQIGGPEPDGQRKLRAVHDARSS